MSNEILNLKSNAIYIAKQKMKYLGFTLTNYVWHLYMENYNTPMKEILEDINEWRDICVYVLEDSILLKKSISPNLIYKFKAIPMKILAWSSYRY